MPTGTIDRLNLDRGFGFITPDGRGPDVFFHFRSLDGLPFDSTLQERRVEFTEIGTDKGPKATSVRALETAGKRR